MWFREYAEYLEKLEKISSRLMISTAVGPSVSMREIFDPVTVTRWIFSIVTGELVSAAWTKLIRPSVAKVLTRSLAFMGVFMVMLSWWLNG